MQRADPCDAQGRTEPRARRQVGTGPCGAHVLILAAILAGGRSSRFGTDKADAVFAGRTLLDHVRALAARHTDAVVVVGRAGGVPDLPAPHLGPLGGIAGALAHGGAHGFETVLTLGCDMPQLPSELIAALLRRAPSYCTEAPIVGHWPSALAPQLIEHIAASERRSVKGWAQSVGALPIVSPAPLANVNTREDLLAL